jgi:TPR repeat protein
MKRQDLFAKANESWDSGDLRGAFELFSIAAKNGDASSQNSLGYFYDHGIGVKKSHENALLWYKRAAKQGDVCAISNIAISFRDIGDLKKAQTWFKKALMLGDLDAALELGKTIIQSKTRGSAKRAKQYLLMAKSAKRISEEAREEASVLIAELERDANSRV